MEISGISRGHNTRPFGVVTRLLNPYDSRMHFVRSHPLLVFLAVYFVARIPFLDWYAAPLTDELYILDQTFFGPGRRLPMFPSLIALMRLTGADPWWSAKFISSLAGVLTVVPAFYMAQKLSSDMVRQDPEGHAPLPELRLGATTLGPAIPWLTAVLVAVSPLLVRWSLRGMTDVVFTMFFTAAVAAAVCWVQEARTNRLGGILAFSGLAMLTRPEGIIALPLLPLLLLAHVWRRRNEGFPAVLKSLLFSVWGWIPWGLWIYWRMVVNSAKGSYASTFSKNLKRIDPAYLGDISAHFGGYAFTTIYILGPVICLGCLMYFADLLERPNRLRFWSGLGFLYVSAATWFIACVHYFFSIRHMIFIYPTLIVMGVIGLWAFAGRWPRTIRVLAGVQVACSVLVLTVGLWVTKDTFKDIKEAAIAAQQGGYNGPLRATDYRQKKSGHYFDGKVIRYNSKARLKAGDRVMFDSFTLSEKGVERSVDALKKRYAIQIISDQRARQSQFLTDDITSPVKENGKVRRIMSRLFVWQTYRSVVVEIKGPKK